MTLTGSAGHIIIIIIIVIIINILEDVLLTKRVDRECVKGSTLLCNAFNVLAMSCEYYFLFKEIIEGCGRDLNFPSPTYLWGSTSHLPPVNLPSPANLTPPIF